MHKFTITLVAKRNKKVYTFPPITFVAQSGIKAMSMARSHYNVPAQFDVTASRIIKG